MELKLCIDAYKQLEINVLIVPYGIETRHCASHPIRLHRALIVPYGIETKKVF